MSNSSTMIRIQGMYKHYQMGPTTVKAVDHMNLEIAQGEFLAIVGPSGSGKSTLMNIIGCLDSPTGGHYELDGTDVAGMTKNQLAQVRNRNIGFVFQSFNLLPRETALENVELPLIYAGIPAKKRRSLALAMLHRVQLEGREHHIPNKLSGGQRQRVAIARALAGNPKLILADEPTGALDSKTGIEILSLFRTLHAEGVTIIMVTHDSDLARQADRVVQIIDGTIVKDNPTKEWNP